MLFKVSIRKGVDFGYIAEALSLPGCVSQGDTIQETLFNIREAIELYIEDMSPESLLYPPSAF